MCWLTLVTTGCSAGSSQPVGPAPHMKALAADYLAIARPANHRLDLEVSGYDHAKHTNLAVAERALRAEAATERWFDAKLMKIPFPAHIAAFVRALVRQNQWRATLTDMQAGAESIAALLSYTRTHKAADAAVEVQVRLIRRLLGLPPPSTS